MTTKTRGIGYIRVSTDEQAASGLGLADQEQRIKAYCMMRGIDLVKIITDDGYSAGKPLASRPGGAELLASLRRNEAEAVVILKLDRGFRNTVDCLQTVELWERKNIALHIVDLGGVAVDSKSAMGKFMLTVLSASCEMERNQIRERTRAALGVKRRRGERVSRHAPFGFTIDPDGNVRPDASEQAAVAMAVEGRDAGKSLQQIADDITSKGIMGRTGKPISAKTVLSIVERAKKMSA